MAGEEDATTAGVMGYKYIQMHIAAAKLNVCFIRLIGNEAPIIKPPRIALNEMVCLVKTRSGPFPPPCITVGDRDLGPVGNQMLHA